MDNITKYSTLLKMKPLVSKLVRQVSDLNYITATPNSREATRLSCEFVEAFLRTVGKGEDGSVMVNASVCTSAVALSSSPAVSREESVTSDVVLQERSHCKIWITCW